MSSKRKSLRGKVSSLRVRIPLIITVMLVLNLLILFLFFQFFYAGVIAERIESFSGRQVPVQAIRHDSLAMSVMGFELLLMIIMLIAMGFDHQSHLCPPPRQAVRDGAPSPAAAGA